MAPNVSKGSLEMETWKLPRLRTTILDEEKARKARSRRSIREEMLLPLKNYGYNPNNTDVSFLSEGLNSKGSSEDNVYDFLIPASLIMSPQQSKLDEMDNGECEDPQKWMARVFPASKPTGRMDALALDQWLSQMMQRLKDRYTVSIQQVSSESSADEFQEGVNAKYEYMKDTQKLFSVCMHELIRQTAVQCVERGQLLAKVWMRYVELVNVLVMLLKVENDSRKEKEGRFLQQIETLNHNYLQAVRALEVTVTEDVLRVEEFEKKILGLTSRIKSLKQEKLDLRKQLDKSEADLYMRDEELAIIKREREALYERLELAAAQYKMHESRLDEQHRVIPDLKRKFTGGGPDSSYPDGWALRKDKPKEEKNEVPGSSENQTPSLDSQRTVAEEASEQSTTAQITHAILRILKSCCWYDVVMMEAGARESLFKRHYSGSPGDLEKWIQSKAGKEFLAKALVDAEGVKAQITRHDLISSESETDSSTSNVSASKGKRKKKGDTDSQSSKTKGQKTKDGKESPGDAASVKRGTQPSPPGGPHPSSAMGARPPKRDNAQSDGKRRRRRKGDNSSDEGSDSSSLASENGSKRQNGKRALAEAVSKRAAGLSQVPRSRGGRGPEDDEAASGKGVRKPGDPEEAENGTRRRRPHQNSEDSILTDKANGESLHSGDAGSHRRRRRQRHGDGEDDYDAGDGEDGNSTDRSNTNTRRFRPAGGAAEGDDGDGTSKEGLRRSGADVGSAASRRHRRHLTQHSPGVEAGRLTADRISNKPGSAITMVESQGSFSSTLSHDDVLLDVDVMEDIGGTAGKRRYKKGGFLKDGMESFESISSIPNSPAHDRHPRAQLAASDSFRSLAALRAREKEEELRNRARLDQLSLQEQKDKLAKVGSRVETNMHQTQRGGHASFIPPAYKPFFKATWKSYSPQEWNSDRLHKLVDKIFSDRLQYDDKVALEPKKSFPEFLYTFFINNFGTGAMAEKRLLDFFVNCKLDQSRVRTQMLCSAAHIFQPFLSLDAYSAWQRMAQGIRRFSGMEAPAAQNIAQMLEEDFEFLPLEFLSQLKASALAAASKVADTPYDTQLELSLQAAAQCWEEGSVKHVWSVAHQLFDMADTDKDGKVSLAEFQMLGQLLTITKDIDRRVISNWFPEPSTLMPSHHFVDILRMQCAQKNALPRVLRSMFTVSISGIDGHAVLLPPGSPTASVEGYGSGINSPVVSPPHSPQSTYPVPGLQVLPVAKTRENLHDIAQKLMAQNQSPASIPQASPPWHPPTQSQFGFPLRRALATTMSPISPLSKSVSFGSWSPNSAKSLPSPNSPKHGYSMGNGSVGTRWP